MGAVVNHQYVWAGVFTATLTVTDSDGATASATASIDVAGPPPPTLSTQGGVYGALTTASVPLVLSSAPLGLSGYDIQVFVSDPTLAEISDVQFPSLGITQFERITNSRVQLQAADLTGLIGVGATDVEIATLTVRNLTGGLVSMEIQVIAMDDDFGGVFSPNTDAGIVEFVYPTLSGMTSPVQDLDGDGPAEDINGNDLLDFADVVVLFEQIDSVEVQSNPAVFDFNGNSLADMADIEALFDAIVN